MIINNKNYIGTPAFIDLFLFDSADAVAAERSKGLPYIKHGKRYWYNVEDCRAWYAGTKKAAQDLCKGQAAKKIIKRKYNTKSRINKG